MLKLFLPYILHTVIVLGLLCTTAWDIWLISNTYVNDNLVTLVTWKSINDSYPFLQGLRLKIILDNQHQNTVFEEIWANDSIPIDRIYEEGTFENAARELEEFKSHYDAESDSLPIMIRFRVSETLGQIYFMDHEAQSQMIGSLTGTVASEQEIERYRFLQNLLQYPKYLVDLEKATWRDLQPAVVILNINPDIVISDMFTLDRLQPADAIVSAPLQEMLYPKISSDLSSVSLSNMLYSNALPLVSRMVDSSLQLIIHPFKSDEIEITNQERVTITLTVTNIGVFDRSETIDCIDKPFIDLLSNETDHLAEMESCEIYRYIETMVPICQCIPFTFKRQFAMVIRTDNLPFCTPDLYLKCMNRVDRALVKSEKCLPSCTQVKNQYSVFTTKSTTVTSYMLYNESREAGVMVDRRPTAVLNLRCNDAVYGLYTEKFQLTLQQFISQVGGDIGLYTGLSILGIWQLLVFIYRMYRRHASEDGLRQIRHVLMMAIDRHPLSVWDDVEENRPNRILEIHPNDSTSELILVDVKIEMQLMKRRIAELETALKGRNSSGNESVNNSENG